MRVLFLLFCLLTIPAFADGVSCTISSTQTSYGTPCLGNNTTTTPGKYGCTTNMSGQNCSICGNDLWCPGDGYAYKCDQLDGGAFPYSDKFYEEINGETVATVGARSKYECYKKLDGNENTTGHGKKCKDQSDGDIEYSDSDNTKKCRAYYRGEDQNPYVSCDGTTGTFSTNGNVEHSQNTDSDGYHMEGNQCYFNTRNCNLFYNNCNSGLGQNQVYEVTGTLQWHGDDNWNYDLTCGCKIKGDFITTDNNYGCNGYFSRSLSSVTGTETVSSTQVSFNNYQLSPYCSGCLPGYYSAGDSNGSFSCLRAEQGYYSLGCGTHYTNDEPNEDENSAANCWNYTNGTRFPCYAGMTTDDTGSTTRNDCHYTNNTNFCDAYGCVSMGQLLQNTGTSQGNWTWYMQQ